MKKIVAVIELGTLLQTVSYVNDGEIVASLEIPVDNVPETIAYYAHEYKVNDILIFGDIAYIEKVKEYTISKSLQEYGKSNLIIELKEI